MSKAHARTLIATAINLVCFLRANMYRIRSGHDRVAEEILGALLEKAENEAADFWETIDCRFLEVIEDCTIEYRHGQDFHQGHFTLSFTKVSDQTDRYVIRVDLELGICPKITMLQTGKA